MSSPTSICAAWNLDSAEFVVPLLLKEQTIVTLAPPFKSSSDCRLNMPTMCDRYSQEQIELNPLSPDESMATIKEAVYKFCKESTISVYTNRINTLHASLCSTNTKYTDDDGIAFRNSLMKGLYESLNIKASLLHYDQLESKGYDIVQKFRDVDSLTFRGRGRVILNKGTRNYAIKHIKISADGCKATLTGLHESVVFEVDSDDFKNGTFKLVLRGSIRPISLESAGIMAHAPWHSKFCTGTPPTNTVNYRVKRVISPMWQRYECDAHSISENWCIGGLISDYIFASDRAAQYVSEILQVNRGALITSDTHKLRCLAMASHGRRWLACKENRIKAILEEYRALNFGEGFEKSRIPLLRVLDDYVVSSNIGTDTTAAVLTMLRLLDGALKTSLFKSFVLLDTETLDIMSESVTSLTGYVPLPIKKGRK